MIVRTLDGRLIRVAAIALAVVATSRCGDKKSPAAGTAALVTAGKGVTIQRGGQTITATKGVRLVVGDVILTGSDGAAEVSMSDGHVLQLGPSSSAAIQREAGAGSPMMVVLELGSVRTITGRDGLRLVVGTPFGRADVANGSEVEVSMSSGFSVLMGSIEVTFDNGKRLTIPAGGRFAAEKAPADPQPRKPEPNLVIKPLKFSMIAGSRDVQIKRSTDENWRASKQRESLGQDDAVRTRKGDGTRLQLDARTSVLLRPRTDIVANESGLTEEGSAARLTLRSGSAKFLAVRDGKSAGRHEVEIAGQHIRIEPGPAAANVDVSTSREGQGQIVVNLGRAILPDGETIEAGNSVALKEGAPASAPVPLAATFVELKAGGKAEVYCGGRVPPVRFTWEPGDAKPPFAIELARDEQYSTNVFKEEVHQHSLVYGMLKPGTWFWRVQLAETWQRGTVRVGHDQSADCPKCKRLNVVEDTGHDTTLYFQETLPAITLHWNSVTNAAKYRVRLFSERSLDKPIIEEMVKTSELPLAAGRLSEGKYAWNMQAFDADNNAVLTGAVNRLTIAYDNAVSGLQIRVPARGATTRGPTAWTRGEIALGQRLVINGVPAALDGKGRFGEKVPVSKGFSQIVYHVTGAGGRDQYWVRDILAN
jgi:hypothetical protein